MPSPTDALSAGLCLSLAGIPKKPGNDSNGEANGLDSALAAGNKLAEITKHHVEYESADSQQSSTQNVLKSKYIVLDTKLSPMAQSFNSNFSNGTKDTSSANNGITNGNKFGNNGAINSHQTAPHLNGMKGVHLNGLSYANINGIVKNIGSVGSVNGVKKLGCNGSGKGVENGSSKSAINNDAVLPEPKHVLYQPEKVILGWQSHFRAGAGMVNVGNTCYLNATLQALFHIPAFVEWLLNDTEHMKKCEQINGSGFGDCITCSMARTLRVSQNNSVVKPSLITSKIKMICRHMSHGSQEDAHEFMRHLLENMEKSYLVRCKAQKLEPYSKETTPINQIFGGYIRTEVKCLKCNYASTTFQHFQDLILDIRKASKVEDAMDQYFSREKLDGENSYKCEKCKCGVPATKKYSIERPPRVLCIQLKRFNAAGMKFSKPVEHKIHMDLKRYVHPQSAYARNSNLTYKLISMVTHVGPSSGCGHYTAIAQCSSRTFHHFDDTHVNPVSLQTVLNNPAYILIYEMEPLSSKQSAKLPATSSISSITALNHNNHNNVNGSSKTPLPATGGLPLAKDRDRVTFGLTPKPTSTQPRLVLHSKKPEVIHSPTPTLKAPATQNASFSKEARPPNFIGPIQVTANGKLSNMSSAKDKPVAARAPKLSESANLNHNDVSRKDLPRPSKSIESEKRHMGSLVPYDCDDDSSSRDSSLSPPLNDDQEVLTVKATKPSGWQVTNSSGLRSPSIHSESSNHSVASATGSNWNVTENQPSTSTVNNKSTPAQKVKEKKLKERYSNSVNYSSDPEPESQSMKASGNSQLRAKSAERDLTVSGIACPTNHSLSMKKARVWRSSVSSESDSSSSSKIAKKKAKIVNSMNQEASKQNQEEPMKNNGNHQDTISSNRTTDGAANTLQHSTTPSSTWSGNGNTNTVNDLMKMSHQGFGNDRVTSWNGEQSHIERNFDEDRQASWKRSRDEYEVELDRGRMKKVKKDNRYRPYPNSFHHRPGSTPFHQNRKYNNYSNPNNHFKNRHNHGHRKWQSNYYKSTDHRHYHRN